MRLPRRTAAQSQQGITQELQSVRAGAITPAERARETTAKFGAISSVADAFSQVAQAEAEARAEEEYTDAVFDYESQLQDYDIELETKPFDLDENDNIIVDDKQMVKDELSTRRKMSGGVRENMTSGMGKAKFDKYLVQSNLRRNADYTARATERRIKALGAQAKHKVNTLILGGNHDAAYERGKVALQNQAISQAEFDSMRITINRDRTTSNINNALMGDTSHGELNTLVDVLDDGKWPVGRR